MRKLSSFTFTTLNGFFKGLNEDTSWHVHGEEENQFSQQSLKKDHILLFGRKTYEMMVGFWSQPIAAELFPEVAAAINKAEKIVFSNTLKEASWNNTSVISGDIIPQIKNLKQTATKDLTILGSGSIITQLSNADLIDEYGIMVDPVIIGQGTPLFSGVNKVIELELAETRAFKSGVVLLVYKRII
ncbi:dihydrofolate reductase family protein [Ferruginibacter albus]|uniref:dihydrofolate reductase family protein n=1 Tax=Ferruginibacter albus TaxID=2875540 RepID=UPI001CC4C35C|nr:dihydrofolate reductase family protein [Ferruginibacter albus]UAY50967.1 dihydrofolate reductase family protein [Ferruginibacter albus]